MRFSRFLAVAAVLASTSAAAADLLPLKMGIYVPTKVACRGASNADIVPFVRLVYATAPTPM